MQEIIAQFADRIRAAAANKAPLHIRGSGSKDFYGGMPTGTLFETGAYHGIVDYEPSELVITARTGTTLTEIEATLRDHGQMLAFEPPHFGPHATLGGSIASGLSGPRRAQVGAVRDFMLGVRLLDGQGDDLRFGGRVMKNVAGFDVARLVAGSLGTLGVILEASLKVLPLPPAEVTLRFELGADEAITQMNRWAGQALPISATCHHDRSLMVRLSGSAAAVRAAAAKLGGDEVTGEEFWHGLREQELAFFSGPLPLWRLSLKATTPALDLPGKQLLEWQGALRWLKSDADAATIRAAATHAGGHATLFRAVDKSCGVFQPLPPPLLKIQSELKRAFDRAGIFNPGRLYPDL